MTRCGYTAIVGAPNAGKSTLMNRIVGEKIAIVTPKAQTTRNKILGIRIEGESQLIFVDTPGIFAARQKFEQAMVASAISGAHDAEIVLFMVDAERGLTPDVERVLEKIQSLKAIRYLVLNKVDKADKVELLKLTQELFLRSEFMHCFMISALTGDGVSELIQQLAKEVPEGPWLYPEDQLTDIPQRALAAEITREKLFMQLQNELPYSVTVETEEWLEKRDGSVKISQVVYVRSDGQKKIVIGENGQMLKRVGQLSRTEMERIQGRKVHLFLFVKVDENWKEKSEFYQSIGLDFKN